MIQGRFPVIDQIEITKHIFRITIQSKEIARECRPGQFVQVRVNDGIDPLLRRPFSIHRVQRDKESLDLFYKVVGRGTQLMQLLKKGDVIDLIGPLGNGFLINRDFQQAIIIAGGMGSAPMFFLIDELLNAGKKIILFWGVKDKSEVYNLPELKKNNMEIHISTENGSMGYKGIITDIFKSSLHLFNKPNSMKGFVCGPKGMIRSLQSVVGETPFQWQVSMEEKMACSMGVCMGCGIKIKSGIHKMVCSDGPVFDLSEVVLDG